MELYFDPTVFVAMDLLANRSGDHCALAGEQAGLGMFEWRAERRVPRRGGEAVAVALLETVGRHGVAGHYLFQHLPLLPFVLHRRQPPQFVPLHAPELALL